MPKMIKTCRVCGRSYEACRTVNHAVGVFRWQEVACSPECGSVYLQRLNESRGIRTGKPEEKPVDVPVNESFTESAQHPTRKKKRRMHEVSYPLGLETENEDVCTGQK